MIYAMIGAVLIVIALIVVKYTKAKEVEKMANRIRKEFGAEPNRDFIRKNVQYLMAYEEKKYDIDEITWNDLDMDTVYTRINNCNSFIGEQVLYRQLHAMERTKEEVENREKMIQDFVSNTKRREDVQVLLESIGRQKASYFLPMFIKEVALFEIGNIWIYRLLSVLLAVTLILGIAIDPFFFYGAGLVFLINLVIYTLGKNRFEMHLGMLGSVLNIVASANILIQKHELIDGELARESIEGVERMKKMASRITTIQRKIETGIAGDMGALLFDYLIGSTLWDFHVFHKAVQMLAANKEEFMKIYTYIGEIDATISIASYRESVSHYCQPKFQKENVINFVEMYHPLLSEPVCNDVKMDSNFIVTGSNASGKSTYIKGIAINMILAQSINMALAKSANIPYANILTSMAVRDDVILGESYYMKEIKHLKRIVIQLKKEKLAVCIVDEILRGTNTEERIAASVAILDYLNNQNCLAIVASHDIKISELLEGKFRNCHFNEVIDKKDICFDYKVKMGVSKTKNAIKLLRYVGFPEEIVKNAEDLAHNL
ncbi:hypothetical protein LQZ18_09640 [Lachnospiraceae bacterium ZAX-1]